MGFKVFLNGEYVESEDAKISVFDHGLLYGDGVFEGIRSYNRRVFCFEEHLDRLYEGADALRLAIPLAKEELQEKIIETLKMNDLDNAYIRVVVTRGKGDLGLDPRKCTGPTVFIIADKVALYPKEFYEKGLPVIIAKTRRNHPESLSPRIKSLNYLNNILGKIDAMDGGTEEAIMLTVDGYVVECNGDNIFIVEKGKLIAPPNELGALFGVTQAVVIELAEKRGIEFAYEKMKPERLFSSDECFLTGTAAEVIPVIRIDDKIIGTGKPGEITKTLMRDFWEFTKENGTRY